LACDPLEVGTTTVRQRVTTIAATQRKNYNPMIELLFLSLAHEVL
jgi:hypothetical protein